ncbi:MAG: tetratricopeptide repeat protein, partial [Ideonella sp.]|nr:tetratricopeptide repeat protein [Ideonella sp.]
RVPPALSLARWRLRGELAELGPRDLQFDTLAARALRAHRGLQALPDDLLQAALVRTQGWAAGLQLLLGQRQAAGALPTADGPAAQRHLFDFFAQEVLAELPDELQAFVLHCAVLPELQPALCEAVTGRTDARAVLDGLYRRQLFLTALDEALPVLRFHDLFLDFLRAELTRRDPAAVASLHARAAAAETRPERAVHHWLAASRWTEALAAMHGMADELLASGGVARLEKWLAVLPAELQARAPEAAHLQGMCAWSSWDWRAARPHFRRAVDAYRGAGRHDAALAALGMLGACHNALGDLAGSSAVLQEVQHLGLAPPLQVRFDSLAAWSSLALGEPQAIGPALARMAEHVALAPATRYPNIVDMGYGHFVGVPGTRAPMQRLLALCAPLAGPGSEVQVPSMRAWLAFWHGERGPAEATLAELLALQQHMPGARMLALSATHLQALHRGARGDHAAAIDGIARLVHAQPGEASQTAGWLRTYLHVQARLHWLAQDAAGLGALLPRLGAPRQDDEWPVLDMGAVLVRGRHALLSGQPDQARPLLEQAVALHARWRMPAFFGDARLALAAACLPLGDTARAVALFAEVLQETADEPVAGPLLLEPAPLLQVLWDHPTLPEALRPIAATVRQRLAAWAHAGAAPAAPAGTRASNGLTEREDEVLGLMAQGQSNKHIARTLGLSPHTVKRHVANIMDKLGVATRTQAAGHWHRR